jgi:hypothetical protein
MKSCIHTHTVRITFDTGKTPSTYELCDNCQSHPIFSSNIISKEVLK